MKKNEEYMVKIIDNGYEGEGIAKIDNFTIFIPGAIAGEVIKIVIVKVTPSFAYGKILEILESSPDRVHAVDCTTYKCCGGCNLRHMQYAKTLELKRNIVQNLVNKNLQTNIQVQNTIGMENPFHYRNKAQYPVGINKEGKAIIGVFANRSHEVIETNHCQIQNEEAETIAKYICEFAEQHKISVYNEETQKGLLRHIVVKTGFQTKEIMCIIVINGKKINQEKLLVQELTSKFPNIKTIVKNVNVKNTNVILGKENITIYGEGYITDKLGEYTFKISPLSFYQINPIQTEKLYQLALEKAELTGNEILLDLYCGIGTIGIFMSKQAKKVYGIEIVEEAIQDAKENCKLNGITNAEYYVGDTEKLLTNLIETKNIIPDVVVVDPPRKGLDKTTICNLKEIKPKKIIYISCNPATLVRDLSYLEETYDIKEIQPVDMFPYTSHVECVSALKLRKDSK